MPFDPSILTPFDHLATRSWRCLFEGRRVATPHYKLSTKPLESDFHAAPGAPLPAWFGIMNTMAESGPLIGESETGYLTLEELEAAELKLGLEVHGHRLRVQRLARKSGMKVEGQPGPSSLLIVAERVSEEVLTKGLKAYEVTHPEAGLWICARRHPLYIVSLTELAFRADTAVVHLLGRGPHLGRALEWLLCHPSAEAVRCGDEIAREIEAMHVYAPVEEMSEEDRRALDGLYESMRDGLIKRGKRLGRLTGRKEGRMEGRMEGRTEGRMEGQQRFLLKQLALKFGPLPSSVVARVRSLEEQSELDRLVEQILTAASLEELGLT